VINSAGWRGIDPASAYDSRCRAYSGKGDTAHAIADCSEAIRISPHYDYAYVIYADRGDAYRLKGDLDRAIADYGQAIRLDPKFADAYDGRGRAYEMKGQRDHAVPDYSAAINLNPDDEIAYGNRARAYLYSGNPAKALADIERASELAPGNVYDALWVDIIRRRNDTPSRLSQAATSIDMTRWPAPLIRMFLGQMTPAAVLAAADSSDAVRKKGQTCIANFYTAELAVRTGAKDEAARLFRLAASDCPHDYVEWTAASPELKALGSSR
jgi:lipoprotein NlpI